MGYLVVTSIGGAEWLQRTQYVKNIRKNSFAYY